MDPRATRASSRKSSDVGAMRYSFKLGERLVAVGHTGTGKTHLVTRFLTDTVPARLPVVVVDPKNHFEPPSDGWEVVESLPAMWERVIRREKRPELLRVIVRPFQRVYPLRKMLFDPLNDLYQRLYAAGHLLGYFDDLQALTDEHRASAPMHRLWEMGRARFLSIWQSTLVPSSVPRPSLRESDHWFIFFLKDVQDRIRVGEYTGLPKDAIPGPGSHDFYYVPPGVEIAPILVHQDSGEAGKQAAYGG